MITYRLWTRHPEGKDDLHCPVILCDACERQINEHGNVYWIPDDNRLWFTHKHPCSELDRAIQAETGKHVLFEELSVWLDQLRHNALDRDPLPLDELETTP